MLAIINACSLSIDAFSNNLDKAIRSSNDPQTIAQALPAYILLIDSLIENDPEDEEALKASANLLNAYSGLIAIELETDTSGMVSELKTNRLKQLSQKSLDRASAAICQYEERYCGITKAAYSKVIELLKTADEDETGYLYSLAQSWTSQLQLNRDDWNMTAKIPHIKLILETVIELDKNWQQGSAYMYLGVLNSLIPSTLGGKPETGKQYFETAIELSNQHNLMAKVLYAEYYARLVFNQQLHDRLLNDVLLAENTVKEFGLMNTLAKMKAVQLTETGKDYF